MSTKINGSEIDPRAMMLCSSLTIGQTGIEIPGGTLITQDSPTKLSGKKVHQKATTTPLISKAVLRSSKSIDITIRNQPKLRIGLRTT